MYNAFTKFINQNGRKILEDHMATQIKSNNTTKQKLKKTNNLN